ncbi:MAG: hypothetical protein ABG776_04755 [Cyanobacteria bacterium J06555_13]
MDRPTLASVGIVEYSVDDPFESKSNTFRGVLVKDLLEVWQVPDGTEFILLSVLLVLSIGISGQKLKQQIQRQTDLLEDELVIDMHEYSQLQRELLRLKIFIASMGKETTAQTENSQVENSQTEILRPQIDTDLDAEQLVFHVD